VLYLLHLEAREARARARFFYCMEESVILVDEHDTPLGSMEKLAAHRQGKLHRSLSVLIFDANHRLMMQRRALHKYHSGGLWTNTCCSHPRPEEETLAAAHRRLMEEMGFDCDLREVHAFEYKTYFANGLIEHEYDHVFVGESSAEPIVNPDEVMEWKWMSIPELRVDMQAHPDDYTFWLKYTLDDVLMRSGKE
jgi:isopentenyl-diphosphate delta-isomerase